MDKKHGRETLSEYKMEKDGKKTLFDPSFLTWLGPLIIDCFNMKLIVLREREKEHALN